MKQKKTSRRTIFAQRKTAFKQGWMAVNKLKILKSIRNPGLVTSFQILEYCNINVGPYYTNFPPIKGCQDRVTPTSNILVEISFSTRPTQSLGGVQVKIEVWGPPLTKIILVDIALDNSTFIGFFTGEHEVNYPREDMRVLPWLGVQ